MAGSEFFDAERWQAIAPGAAAILPVDGRFAVTSGEASRFGRVRWYTVTGDGTRAGAIDWEPGNPCFTAAALRGFVRVRRSLGARARVYVQRSLAAEAIAALRDFGAGELLAYPRLLWWIPTADGAPWTAETLAANLADVWDAPIPAGQIWANQNHQMIGIGGNPVDVNALFGEW